MGPHFIFRRPPPYPFFFHCRQRANPLNPPHIQRRLSWRDMHPPAIARSQPPPHISHPIRAAASSFVLPGLFHFVAGINLACFLSRQAPPMRKGAYLKLYTRHSFVRGKVSATAANLNLLPPKGCINLA